MTEDILFSKKNKQQNVRKSTPAEFLFDMRLSKKWKGFEGNCLHTISCTEFFQTYAFLTSNNSVNGQLSYLLAFLICTWYIMRSGFLEPHILRSQSMPIYRSTDTRPRKRAWIATEEVHSINVRHPCLYCYRIHNSCCLKHASCSTVWNNDVMCIFYMAEHDHKRPRPFRR